MEDATPARTPAGRPAVVATCTECRTKIVHLGGSLVADAPVVAWVAGDQPVRIRIAEEHRVAESKPIPVLEVYGIGPVRARQLGRLGIETVQDLAAAEPALVAEHVVGVSIENAVEFISDASRIARIGRIEESSEP